MYSKSDSTKFLATVSKPRLVSQVGDSVWICVRIYQRVFCNHCNGSAGMIVEPFVLGQGSSQNMGRMPPGQSRDTRRSMSSALCSSSKCV